jgi:hypothetical protein
MDQLRFRFKIDDLSLETTPMKRVAEYLNDLALLLGEQKHVHLAEVISGSIDAVIVASAEAAPKIAQRIRDATHTNGVQPSGPPEAIRAAKSLTDKLHEDKTGAVFMFEAGAEIVRFEPPAQETTKQVFGPFNQEGTLDGVVVRLGGINDPVLVHLESDEGSHLCYATRSVARELARHIFDIPLRVFGQGRWLRTAEGKWILEAFTIRDFQPLNDEPISSVLTKLRAVPGNEWNEMENPLEELARLHSDDDDSDDD